MSVGTKICDISNKEIYWTRRHIEIKTEEASQLLSINMYCIVLDKYQVKKKPVMQKLTYVAATRTGAEHLENFRRI